ncbi:MAG: hypothetical protein ABIQ31_06760 [Ferruginibacter sp.]
MKANLKNMLACKHLYGIVFQIVLVFIFQGCHSKFSSKPGPSIVEIKSNVKAPQGIAFIDVNDVVLKNVHGVKITLIDPGKMVLSSNGIAFEAIELAEGIMSVGLSPRAEFSIQNPYRFSIRAEAKGYMTTVRSIVITDATPNYTPIYMAKLDSLPPTGLAAAAGDITAVKKGTVTTDQVLGVKLPKVENNSLVITIPRGTKLYNGKEQVKVDGPLSYRLLFGKPRDRYANRVFPGGFEVTDAIDDKGNNIAKAASPIFFTTAGWFSLEMNIGKTTIDHFSKPLEIEIPIADTVINPTTKMPIAKGDTIPVWSLDNQTGTWHLESNVEITSSGSGLKAKTKISHLSSVNFDYWSNGCLSEILVDFNPSEFTGSHLTDYINTADNSILRRKLINFSDHPSPGAPVNPLHVLRAPDGIIGKLFVHSTPDQTSSIIGESTPLTCASTGTCTDAIPGRCLGRVGSLVASCTLDFKIRDASGATSPLCTNSVWIKDVASGLYHTFEGALNQGIIIIQQQPIGTGLKEVFLWYIKSPGISVGLRVLVNFDADNPSLKIFVDNRASPEPERGTSTRTPATGLSTKIDIVIPQSIIGVCN